MAPYFNVSTWLTLTSYITVDFRPKPEKLLATNHEKLLSFVSQLDSNITSPELSVNQNRAPKSYRLGLKTLLGFRLSSTRYSLTSYIGSSTSPTPSDLLTLVILKYHCKFIQRLFQALLIHNKIQFYLNCINLKIIRFNQMHTTFNFRIHQRYHYRNTKELKEVYPGIFHSLFKVTKLKSNLTVTSKSNISNDKTLLPKTIFSTVLALSWTSLPPPNFAFAYSLSRTKNIPSQTSTHLNAPAVTSKTFYQAHTAPILCPAASLVQHLVFLFWIRKTFLLQIHKNIRYLLLHWIKLWKFCWTWSTKIFLKKPASTWRTHSFWCKRTTFWSCYFYWLSQIKNGKTSVFFICNWFKLVLTDSRKLQNRLVCFWNWFHQAFFCKQGILRTTWSSDFEKKTKLKNYVTTLWIFNN